MTSDYTGLWRLLYDWQTLIAGALAVFAAVYATRPVRRQLNLTVLERLEAHVDAIESKRRQTRKLLRSITGALLLQLGVDDENREPNIGTEWASGTEGLVDSVAEQLTRSMETSRDGDLIDEKMAETIQQCKALSRCLWDIHAPYSLDFGGPSGPNSAEEPDYRERGKLAERDLMSRIDRVSEARGALDSAFADKIAKLRKHMRQIDREIGA